MTNTSLNSLSFLFAKEFGLNWIDLIMEVTGSWPNYSTFKLSLLPVETGIMHLPEITTSKMMSL